MQSLSGLFFLDWNIWKYLNDWSTAAPSIRKIVILIKSSNWLVVVERFNQGSEVYSGLQFVDEEDCDNVDYWHETSSVGWRLGQSSCTPLNEFLVIIHLDIDADERVAVSFVRGELLHHIIVDLRFNKGCVVAWSIYHVILHDDVILTHLHVVVDTLVCERCQVIGLVAFVNRVVCEIVGIKISVLNDEPQL